jgi:hypothetical protein
VLLEEVCWFPPVAAGLSLVVDERRWQRADVDDTPAAVDLVRGRPACFDVDGVAAVYAKLGIRSRGLLARRLKIPG